MIGRLNQRITIQRKTLTPDLMGGATEAWSDLATVWAGAKVKAGREALDEARMNASATVVFTLYSRSDVIEGDRIMWDSRAHNIRVIRRDGGQPLMMVIEAERGVAS